MTLRHKGRRSCAINDATFEPVTVHGFVALVYFAICFPLTAYSRRLDRSVTIAALPQAV